MTSLTLPPVAKLYQPIIFTLPLEIRQQILSYAFCEAVAQDIEFNATLQKEVPPLAFSAGSAAFLFGELEKMEIAQDECSGFKKCRSGDRPPCAPRIFAMANKISGIHPQFKEEVKFVFKQCLEQFRS